MRCIWPDAQVKRKFYPMGRQGAIHPCRPSAFINNFLYRKIMQNAQAFEQFLVLYGLQAITVKGYIGSAKRFTRIVGENPSDEDVKKFVYNLYTSSYSYSHKINTVLAIEKYMAFLGRPVRLGRQKKPKRIIKDTLTEAEVTKLIFSCKNIREKAIITLLAYSGIRNQELCNLKVKDVDLGKNQLTINQGKGLKDGKCEISPECTKILLEYLTTFEYCPRGPEEYLFTTLRENHQYHTGDLRKLVHVLARRAKIGRRVWPHLIRHSLASNLLLRGAHIILIQRQLRHTMLETTLHYVNSIVFGERNNYEKFCPSYL